MKSVIALVQVFYDGTKKEEFLVQYSSEEYPEPDKFREALEKNLRECIRQRLSTFKDVKSFLVGIEANNIVGHFLDSVPFPGLEHRARTFIVNFYSK